MISFAGASFAWGYGMPGLAILCVLVGVDFVFETIRGMIDASNANYLMHQWDLNYLLRRFAMTPEQREQMAEKNYFIKLVD